jgi:hypothetical protein
MFLSVHTVHTAVVPTVHTAVVHTVHTAVVPLIYFFRIHVITLNTYSTVNCGNCTEFK